MKEFRLGVLFVHGIGTQPPRDTLVRWGDVLLKVIGRATEEEPGRTIPMVGRGDAGDRSGDKPAEVAVEFRCNDRDQKEKWLLAEGWWADSFPAPTYSGLVSWSFRAVPWAIALHIAQRFWQRNPKASKAAWYWACAKAITQLLGAMALMPVFMILLALTLLLGLLPIPELRSLILSTQTALIGTIGDSLAFVESPLRAALIRGRILEGLERLKGRCERTVIVAHSQGAAATLDALGGILDHDEAGERPSPASEGPVPDALVTFGSGINQLVSLKVLSAGRLEKRTGINASSVAIVTTLGMVALLILLFVGFRSESINVEQLAYAFLAFAACLGLGALLGVVIVLLIKLTTWVGLGAWYELVKSKFWFLALMYGIAIAVAALAMSTFSEPFRYMTQLPIGPVFFFPVILGNLAYSMWLILSPATRTAVTSPVHHPPGLSRWMDVYASADPVPNGPTRIEQPSTTVTSVQVWNRGALASDHTTYWENLDGFVLRVARICAETAKSPWQDKLPPAAQEAWLDRRALRRVRLLRWTIWYNRALWAYVLYLLWPRYGARVPVPFPLPSWFWNGGNTVARFALLSALVVLAAWVSAGLLRWRWSVWVRTDQEAVLAQKAAGVVAGGVDPFSGQGTVVGFLGLLVLALVLGLESQVSELITDQKTWLTAPGLILIVWTLGVHISWIANRAYPAPQPPQDNANLSKLE